MDRACPLCREQVSCSCLEDEIKFADWERCWDCGGDCVVGHDCGEDTCCCLDPEDNLVCQTCDGAGGWHTDADESNPRVPKPGMEMR